MNPAALYVQETVESVGLIGVHQLIGLITCVSIRHSHEDQGPGFGKGSEYVSPCDIYHA